MLSDNKVVEGWTARANGLSLRGVAAECRIPLPQVQRILEHRTYQDVDVPEELIVAAEAVNTLQRKRYGDKVDEAMVGKIVMMSRKGFTQTEIAEELGVSQPCVHGWLKRMKQGG